MKPAVFEQMLSGDNYPTPAYPSQNGFTVGIAKPFFLAELSELLSKWLNPRT